LNIEVNYVAILIAGAISMAVGFLWYSPLMFAKPWIMNEIWNLPPQRIGKSHGPAGPPPRMKRIVTGLKVMLRENGDREEKWPFKKWWNKPR